MVMNSLAMNKIVNYYWNKYSKFDVALINTSKSPANGYGDYFGCINGVCQGGVNSPLMFFMYMSELLNQLQASGIICHIRHEYNG